MKQSGRCFGRMWRECDRCGFQFPMSKLRRQNGLLLCYGSETSNCGDEQGFNYFYDRIRFSRREGTDELPRGDEVVE